MDGESVYSNFSVSEFGRSEMDTMTMNDYPADLLLRLVLYFDATGQLHLRHYWNPTGPRALPYKEIRSSVGHKPSDSEPALLDCMPSQAPCASEHEVQNRPTARTVLAAYCWCGYGFAGMRTTDVLAAC